MSLSTLPHAAFAAQAAAWCVPLIYGAAAWACRRGGARGPWPAARGAALWAMAPAVLALMLTLASGAPALAAAMLLLVSAIAAAIVLFSRRYLAGEPGQAGYLQALLATLCAVSVVVVTANLLLLALAWACSSAPLRRLLLFYGDRLAARTAAQKMQAFARLGDVLVLAAAGLLSWSLGSSDIPTIVARASQPPALPAAAALGTLLLALGVLLKSAQLPFHGWLIQVMEAPTPVSALLHAGVVNLGGFVLMRLAPLVDAVPEARAVLVVVGALTAAVAALVASTRISIKVSLAWSTCAQMGFMLAECGMGWWAAAALHLLAHSLYKAHAFLASGNAVRDAVAAQMAPRLRRLSAPALLAGGVLSVAAMAVALAWAGASRSMAAPGLWVMVAGLAWTGLARPLGWTALPRQLLQWLGLVALALALHAAVGAVLLPSFSSVAPPAAAAWALGLFWLLLCVVQAGLWLAQDAAWVRRLFPWVYGGFYLDAWVSRWLAAPPPPRHRRAVAQPAVSWTGARQ